MKKGVESELDSKLMVSFYNAPTFFPLIRNLKGFIYMNPFQDETEM
jgi:hypothetical protein